MAIRQPEVVRLWQAEFRNYSLNLAQRDVIAGLTVAAVALPLALAFGVAGGSTPAAGLVTAIIAGLVIGLLSGAPYQISGPTGAMSAVLVVIAHEHGPRGLWVAGLMAGTMILAVGIFGLGRIIHFIPAPVITGFTSGIALTIAIGQIDNFFGFKTPAKDRASSKLIGYFTESLPAINWRSVGVGLLVAGTMLLAPRLYKNAGRLPTALLGVILATGVSWGFGWDVKTIGAVPRGIVLDERLTPHFSDIHLAGHLLGLAFAIALLGAIESLLCGVVAGRMTKQKLAVNQELIAQGIGNIILPFFGGVPATAAIARTSVGVKAGGVTRLVSIVHSIVLLLGALFFGGMIGHVPMAALAGVLFVTAWRMNESHAIKFYWRHRLKGAMLTFFVTMLATIALDLTQAIIAGVLISLVLFLKDSTRTSVSIEPVDWAMAGVHAPIPPVDAKVAYLTGSLFFGSVNQVVETLEMQPPADVLILSMRGVPMVDVSSVQAIEHIWRAQNERDGELFVTGVQPQPRKLFERAGLITLIGEEQFFWSADKAIAKISGGYVHHHFPIPAEPVDEGLDDLPLGVVPAG